MQNTRSIKTVLLTTYQCIKRRCEEWGLNYSLWYGIYTVPTT